MRVSFFPPGEKHFSLGSIEGSKHLHTPSFKYPENPHSSHNTWGASRVVWRPEKRVHAEIEEGRNINRRNILKLLFLFLYDIFFSTG
jgi:hypothetical protein